MSESVKITSEELQGFNEIKHDIQKNMFEFGELYYKKIELDDLYKDLQKKEELLRQQAAEIKVKEANLMNSIFQKYGEGHLDVKNGMFTPN